jgi:type II secretory pathway pseudopilin PulG
MRSKRRSGFSYVELLASVTVITIMMAVTAQMMTLVMVRMASTQRRTSALEAASNVLELVAAQPYDSIDEASLELPVIRELVDQSLSDWEVALGVDVQDQPMPTKRIDVRLVHAAKPNSRPLVLSTWKHEP